MNDITKNERKKMTNTNNGFLNLSATKFEHTYHCAMQAGNAKNGTYLINNIDVYNKIIIDDIELQAFYQIGRSYQFNDYSFPNPKLELSEACTSDVLLKINNLYESDFENDELINEALAEIMELCPAIDNIDKLFRVYEFLNDNKPDISDFIDSKKYTDNCEYYTEDKITKTITLKSNDTSKADIYVFVDDDLRYKNGSRLSLEEAVDCSVRLLDELECLQEYCLHNNLPFEAQPYLNLKLTLLNIIKGRDVISEINKSNV